MQNFPRIAAIATLLAAAGVRAEVADSAANGFTIKTTITIQASPSDVYRRILHISDWWDPSHTYSRDARNLSIEEKPMGCFCEKLADGGVVRHMEVVTLMPGKSIVLTGALGPLQTMAAAGNMRFQLAPSDSATRLEFTYAVTGYLAAGMNSLATPVDTVLKQQLTRLKNYIEQGNPNPK